MTPNLPPGLPKLEYNRKHHGGSETGLLNAAEPLVSAGDIYGVNAPREFYGDYMEARARNYRSAQSSKYSS